MVEIVVTPEITIHYLKFLSQKQDWNPPEFRHSTAESIYIYKFYVVLSIDKIKTY